MHPSRIVLLLGLTAACDAPSGPPTVPPPGFEYAYAAPSCAPWDGYAVSLVLRGAPLLPGDSAIEAGEAAQLRLALYPRGESSGPAPSGLRPGSYRWPDTPEAAVGAWCEGGRCRTLPAGRITVSAVEPGGNLRGTVEVSLLDGRTLAGTFAAEWRPRTMFCL